jgi:hypothetical protein
VLQAARFGRRMRSVHQNVPSLSACSGAAVIHLWLGWIGDSATWPIAKYVAKHIFTSARTRGVVTEVMTRGGCSWIPRHLSRQRVGAIRKRPILL